MEELRVQPQRLFESAPLNGEAFALQTLVLDGEAPPIADWDDRQLAELSPAQLQALVQSLWSTVENRTTELGHIYQLLDAENLHRRQIESELNQERELAYSALKTIADAVITTDITGRLHYFNPIAETILCQDLKTIQGLPITQVLQLIDSITRTPLHYDISGVLQDQVGIEMLDRVHLLRQDGSECPIALSIEPMTDRAGQAIGTIVVLRDMTVTQALTQQLSWQTSHDPLTMLMNRQEFETQLSDAIVAVNRTDQQHILCYVDLDQFKVINETGGHQAGDQLLCELAQLLRQEIRTVDILARLGGDEFGLLLHHCSVSQAISIAERLQVKIQQYRFDWQGQSLNVSASDR
jgi:diguanylate cyclase (GGDEF)-like protein/PAS domain S-box-containing protein